MLSFSCKLETNVHKCEAKCQALKWGYLSPINCYLCIGDCQMIFIISDVMALKCWYSCIACIMLAVLSRASFDHHLWSIFQSSLDLQIYFIYVTGGRFVRTGPLACLSTFPIWFWIRPDFCSCLWYFNQVNLFKIKVPNKSLSQELNNVLFCSCCCCTDERM